MPVLHYRHHTGSGPVDLNKTAIFEGTAGVRPSAPLHVGAISQAEEYDRLQTRYEIQNQRLCGTDRAPSRSGTPSSSTYNSFAVAHDVGKVCLSRLQRVN